MKLTNLIRIMSGIVIILSIISITSLFMLRFSFEQQRNTISNQTEMKNLALQLTQSIQYMVDEARKYSIFGETEHYDNFVRELNETKTREKVLEQFTQMHAPEAELALIKETIELSDGLVQDSEEAFAAVKESNFDKAQLLLFGSSYEGKLETVMQPAEQFQDTLNQRVQREVDAAVQRFELVETIGQVINILLIIATLITFYFIYRKVVKPLDQVTQVANRVAEGDLRVDKLPVTSKNEFGILAMSINRMVDNLRELIRNVDLSTQQVAASSHQLSASIEQTVQTTNQIAETAHELASGAEMQAEGAKAGAISIRDLSGGIQHVTESSTIVSQASEQTEKEAERGSESIQRAVKQIESIHDTVQDMEKLVKGLGERSAQIGNIVEVINSIAAQTNLLALNAAIEAARAGEHGRGFSVVADEVRKLAEQSQESAGQIAALIESIQEETAKVSQTMEVGTHQVGEGIDVMREAGVAFSGILQAARQVSAQIQQLAAAAQQMSSGSEQVAVSVDSMTEIASQASVKANQVAAATDEQLETIKDIAATADSLSQMAQELSELFRKFKL
ncbi:methyl-accepting chemotaxis protein [Brevibacillus fulvus]|uniref:Methyl-accepting chemotaxis protein n=1 Tax=Brevibacillus fulvus TaxID=1125967 RepID=A0A938XZR8_9BACL|nr:methyl-accepting chemotaxis protein [Brevibacillus fulvus]MBM7590741.1 methyl-accepting chemotaxis protein [Brevibacillus fulvus]